jgi:hypothetical protein
MKAAILRSGIDRRTLLMTLALLPALSAPPLSVSASALTASRRDVAVSGACQYR